jgi:tetratricopeptide (TPR) repeat protein
VVDTDVSRFQAELLLKQLERMQALLVQALLGGPAEIPGRVRVVSFSDLEQYRSMVGHDRLAGRFTISWPSQPTILLPIVGLEASPETIAHELAHHLSWYLFPRQPHWFSEGLAMFVQTVAQVRVDEAPPVGTHISRGAFPAGGHWAGLAPRVFSEEFQWTPHVPVRELLEWRGQIDDAAPTRFHISSWLLYHWLWNNRSKQLTAFQKRLADSEDPASAWRATFPEYDPAESEALESLEKELLRYRQSGRFLAYAVAAESDATFAETPLSSADVHMLLALGSVSRAQTPSDRPLRAELDEALREDPSQPLAIWQRATLDNASPLLALRAVTAARPGDWRAWLLLADALGANADPADREAAFRRAVALNPDCADAQGGLARVLATSGRAREALPFANRALDLAPWNPGIIDTLALVAANLGKCPQALLLERRAVALLPPDAPRGEPLSRLAELEERCGSPSAR